LVVKSRYPEGIHPEFVYLIFVKRAILHHLMYKRDIAFGCSYQ